MPHRLNRLSKASITVLICWSLLAMAGPGVHAQTAPSVDYDTFMKLDVVARRGTFNLASPENRAELMRTQITRWVESRRSSLTQEQLALTKEWLAMAVAQNYRMPKPEGWEVRAKDIEARSAALFSREDLRQAVTLQGDYIPKK